MRVRHQPRLKYPRTAVSACVNREIEKELAATARKFGVSKSWVQAVALGDALGIDVVSYLETPKLIRKRA